MCVHLNPDAHGWPEVSIDSPELELQVPVSYECWEPKSVLCKTILNAFLTTEQSLLPLREQLCPLHLSWQGTEAARRGRGRLLTQVPEKRRGRWTMRPSLHRAREGPDAATVQACVDNPACKLLRDSDCGKGHRAACVIIYDKAQRCLLGTGMG